MTTVVIKFNLDGREDMEFQDVLSVDERDEKYFKINKVGGSEMIRHSFILSVSVKTAK